MSTLTSGFWAVFRTKFAALVSARLLYEAFKKNRVWYLPPMLRTLIRSLDLTSVLGASASEVDAKTLLDFIDEEAWDFVTFSQSGRACTALLRIDCSPGRADPNAGDWIKFDDGTWQKLTPRGAFAVPGTQEPPIDLYGQL